MLRYVTRAILVALVPCCLPSPAAGADPPFVPTVFSPVRLAPAYQERWFEPGVCRSATFRSLVADLAASDVIVYVVPRFQGTRRVAGDLQFVAGSPGARILRVTINLRGSQIDPKTGDPIRVTLTDSFYTPNLVVPKRPGGDSAWGGKR